MNPIPEETYEHLVVVFTEIRRQLGCYGPAYRFIINRFFCAEDKEGVHFIPTRGFVDVHITETASQLPDLELSNLLARACATFYNIPN